jgi:valyl-tRNA synthetase
LEYVLKTSLELLHPFMPFTTEELWQKLVLSEIEGMPHEGESIMIASWPKVN